VNFGRAHLRYLSLDDRSVLQSIEVRLWRGGDGTGCTVNAGRIT